MKIHWVKVKRPCGSISLERTVYLASGVDVFIDEISRLGFSVADRGEMQLLTVAETVDLCKRDLAILG